MDNKSGRVWTISPDTGGDNKTGMGYNNRDVRVVKWGVQ